MPSLLADVYIGSITCIMISIMSQYYVVKDLCVATEGREGGQYGFFVHPGESVTLPFKYQCFQAHPTRTDQGNMMLEEGVNKTDSGKKSIKVTNGTVMHNIIEGGSLPVLKEKAPPPSPCRKYGFTCKILSHIFILCAEVCSGEFNTA